MRIRLTAISIILLWTQLTLADGSPEAADEVIEPVRIHVVQIPQIQTPNPPPAEREKKREAKKTRQKERKTREWGATGIMAKDAKIQTPSNSSVLESKTIYNYIPDAVYRIYGAPLHIVDVQLQPGETITSKITAGDTVRWSVGVVSHGVGGNRVQHVLIKPEQAGLETNFIITTDRHSYHLSAKSDPKFYIPTVGWKYPQEEMAQLELQREEDRRLEAISSKALRPADLNFKYKVEAKEKYRWTPVRVFDDGQKTYIQMDPEMKNFEAPVLFIRSQEGLNLVNYRVKGEFYIVDRLFEEAEMRSGKHDVVSIRREKKGWWPWSR